MTIIPTELDHQKQTAIEVVEHSGPAPLLERITHAATCLLPASAALVTLINDELEEIVTSRGLNGHPATARALPPALLKWNAKGKRNADRFQPIVIPDVRRQSDAELSAALLEAGMVAVIAVPLLDGDGTRIGALAVADSTPRRWVNTDVDALGDLAAVTAAAIERSARRQLPAPISIDGDGEAALARLRRSFDDGLAGHAVATADGQILACNAEFARITGFACTNDAIGGNLHMLEPEAGAFHPLLEKLAESALIPLEELQFVRRDGTPAQVMARLAATRDADGKVTEIRAYLVDITNRFVAEQKLRASAERLDYIERATQDVLWDWDLASGKLSWNDAIAQRFRYTNEEVRSTTEWHIERIHPDDRERVMRSIERAIQGTDTSWSDEYRFLRGDDTYAAVLDRAHLVRNGRGEPVRVIGAILDISELRASEEAQRLLAHASAAFEAALETESTARTLAQVGIPVLGDICLVDLVQPDGTLQRLAAAHVDPAREEDLRLQSSVSLNGEENSAIVNAVRLGHAEFGVDAGKDAVALLGIARDTGVHGYAVLPIVARGKVLGAVTFGLTGKRRRFGTLHIFTAKDLARRAGLALDNATLYETVTKAVRARNEVLGVVSHDLRVPVNVIGSALTLLRKANTSFPPEANRLFEVLDRATVQMTVLIEDLLDASRLESNHFTLDNEMVDMGKIIDDACDMLRVLAAGKDISIENATDPGTAQVCLDAAKITRVIVNLLGNAIKFSPQRSVIRVGASVRDAEMQVSVQDEGDGIPQDELPHIFDRFWSGTGPQMRGAGLGLAIARGIVEAHGGRIWATSTVGAGSIFTFALPMAVKPHRGNGALRPKSN